MSSPRERLIDDERVQPAATIRDRILDSVVDGIRVVREEQITSSGADIYKYGLLYHDVDSIEKVVGVYSGNNIVFTPSTQYSLGALGGVDENTLIFVSGNTPDNETSFWVDYNYQSEQVSGITNKHTGSVLWVLADAWARMIVETQQNFAWYANQTNIETASGDYLDDLAKLVGATRQAAAVSYGVVHIVNNAGESLTISSGALVATPARANASAIQIKVTSEHILADTASGSYAVETTTTGELGIGKYQITDIISGFSVTEGVNVSNPQPIGGGQNEETDTKFRERIKLQWDSAGESNRGTIYAIKTAIANTDGVEAVGVYDRWKCAKQGITDLNPPILYNGIVHAYIQFTAMDDVFNSPIKIQEMVESHATKTTIRQAVENVRAAGCTVLLMDTRDVFVDVVATASAATGYATGDVQTAIENTLTSFINVDKTKAQNLYLSELESEIYDMDSVMENSLIITMYKAVPLYRVGYDFDYEMWNLGQDEATITNVVPYDTVTGTTTSSQVKFTFTAKDDEEVSISPQDICTVVSGADKWSINPFETLSGTDITDIVSLTHIGMTSGDKFEFRTRNQKDSITTKTEENLWTGILNISVS